MKVDWSAQTVWRIISLSLVILCFSLVTSFPAGAGHKLDASGTSCYDCHSVGGASDNVISGTRLIKKDARMVEILQGGWTSGQLPCIYCHDATSKSVRENMVGVKDHFSDLSLSKHPADPFAPSNGDAGELDCTDCHINVTYVGGGNIINPNIHGQDMQGVTYSASTGALSVDNTFMNWSTAASVSPWNSDNNSFCTRQCHDSSHTGYAASSVAHGTTSGSLSLDLDSGFSSTVAGCLDETGTTGCHASHKADDNVGLLTIRKPGGAKVERSDCGVCHTNDDGTDWTAHGHGQFEASNNLKCTSCHDASAPHFDINGDPPAANPGMLAFAVSYGDKSGLTGLPTYANCVSSNCHAGYTPHTGDNSVVVGCLDCHEVHGRGIGSNIKMIRENIPVISGTVVSVVYDTVGAYYADTAAGNFSNKLCDNESCHGQVEGPGNYATAMSTHPGGAVTTGCEDCHQHQPSGGSGGGGSWASSGCDTCHGGNGDYWPQTVSTDLGVRPDRAGAHPKHLAALAGNASCGACHPNGGHTGDQDNDPADVHQDGISTTTYLQDFQNQDDTNATYDSTASTCALADCHGESVTPDWYTATPIACNDCHGTGAMGMPSTGLHSLHVNTASSVYVDDCNDCHGANASTGGHGSHWNGAVNVGGQMVSYDGTNVTCANNCHTVTGTNDWQAGAPALGCTDCHAATYIGLGYPPVNGTVDHDLGRNDGGTFLFSKHEECNTCHGFSQANGVTDASGAGGDIYQASYHKDGNIEMNGDTLGGQTANAGYNSANYGCDNACHDNDVAWQLADSGKPVQLHKYGAGGCDGCHGGSKLFWPNQAGNDGTATPNSAGEHAAHQAALEAQLGYAAGTTSDTEQKAMCAYCHEVDPNDSDHPGTGTRAEVFAAGFNKAIWGSNDNTAYNSATGVCTASDCHYNRTTPDGWYGARNSNCTLCHNNGTDDGLLANAEPGTGYHATHVASNSYVPNDCATCHGNNANNPPAGDAAHWNGQPDYANSLTGYPGDGSCTNNCHAGTGVANAWTSGTIGCTDCHSGTWIGGGANGPSSGLHTVTPTVSGQIHSQAVSPSTGCTACHAAVTAQATHINGAFTGGNGQTTQMGLATFYTQTADNEGTCATTTCHTSFSDSWAHVWTNTAGYYTSATASCGGCHGDYNGWNSGVMHNTYGTKGNTQHTSTGDLSYECTDCHAIGATAATYDFAFAGTAWGGASEHGNALITMNNNSTSWARSGGDSGCANSCHPVGYDATHKFTATSWTSQTVAGDAPAGCDVGLGSGCHGVSGENWPSTADTTLVSRPDRAGAHTAHIIAIGTGNNSCATCHPNNGTHGSTDQASDPADVHNDGTNVSNFLNMSGGTDTNGAYDNAAETCSNIDCHAGNTTPAWYGGAASDTTGPVFTPNGNVTASTSASLSAYVSWNPAVDAYPSNPVRYDLYWSTDGTPLTGPLGTMSSIAATGAVAVFTTATSSVEFQVVAKDAAGNTTNSNVSNSVNISGAPGGGGSGSLTLYLRADSGTSIASGITTNFSGDSVPTCGTAATTPVVSQTTFPGPGNQLSHVSLLTTTASGCATNNNYRTQPASGGTGPEWHTAFIYDTTWAADRTMTGRATGNTFRFRRTTNTSDSFTLYFASVDSAGNYTLGTGSVTITQNGAQTDSYTPDMSGMSIVVPAGEKLAIMFQQNVTAWDNNIRVMYEHHGGFMPVFVVDWTEGASDDTTAPVWSGGVSGIAVTDVATDGELQISWNTATDADTPPVTYWLYRNTGTNNPFGAPDASWPIQVGNTSYVDSSLTNGNTYYYGVRAENNDPVGKDRTSNTDTASGSPTLGGGGGGATDCTTCHSSHPGTGAHAVHANQDSDYSECDNCHGDALSSPGGTAGATTYTTGGPAGSAHNNGSTSMIFPGDDAAWSGTNCSNVDCHFNNTTPPWVGGSTNCTSCHAYPPVSGGGLVDHDANLTVAPATLANFLNQHDDCKTCHGIKDAGGGTADTDANYPAGSHGDGFIRMNGPDGTGASYIDSGAGGGGCNDACHANDAVYQMATSATRDVNYGDFGSGDCRTCHAVGNGQGAPEVDHNSPHVDFNGAAAGGSVTSTFNFCVFCHSGHANGSTGANDIEVSTLPATFDNKYGSHGTAFQLGGSQTGSFSSEAEMCWGCHDNLGTPVSEWYDAGDSSDTYKYGTISGGTTASSWFGTWTSSTTDFAYKTGSVTSTHEASEVIGTDITIGATDRASSAGSVSCSTCHDVHNTVSGSPDGSPYLRGTWHPSQYPEDGAPAQNQTTGYISVSYNAGGDNVNQIGGPGESPNKVQESGYHIDDNVFGVDTGYYGFTRWSDTTTNRPDVDHHIAANNAPDYSAVSATLGDVDGQLCLICHGDLSSLITKWSGHGAVKDSSRTIAQNDIFKPIHAERQHAMINPFNGWAVDGGDMRLYWDVGSNNGDGANGGWYRWAVRLTQQATTSWTQNYHNFSCSKCHTPHASRLPRLRVNNCLNRDFALSGGSGVLGDSYRNARGTYIYATGAPSGTNVLSGWENTGRGETDTDAASENDANNYSGTDSEGVNVDNGFYSGIEYRGGKQAVHCHNNTETGASTNYWQNIN